MLNSYIDKSKFIDDVSVQQLLPQLLETCAPVWEQFHNRAKKRGKNQWSNKFCF